MSKSTYPLKLPSSVKAAAARLAKEEGVSKHIKPLPSRLTSRCSGRALRRSIARPRTLE